ncbi:CBP4 domain-containing protein [Lasiodiplodia theobromae]|uniref:Cytochrome b mRNA-processing protein 4 n=2 Tax=Lasiodiplodia TaxID=66739 RepID=A0A5N5DDG9_9PEZI|nr:CBP4 domain-containing protein [Lasiodiplodia theobromae]KAB2575731.1 Assembly factor cbp4 [Lasiodiplodia theobromae]KAF4537630.1 CBP4 domain-containing protein [Lasiodiplodia theobromae]KAF9639401.1 CBP4 domain-containing protein [Lasiodiplodia theobromae]KAK0642455.1 Assembly factor cbp4 [Lasiodiplodia hormozganensis]
MPGASTYFKMFAAGAVLCIGGPALTYYVTPTEEELFKRYNPELQKRSLENRIGKQQDFDDFVTRLKEYSKSDKPIWEAAEEAQRKHAALQRQKILDEQRQLAADVEKRRQEIRQSAGEQ